MIRVSTIIPAYNSSATIARAIDSALGQEFSGQEVVVINDGSTDATMDVLRRYGVGISVIQQPNRGPAAARNAGAARARGKYLAFLDSDDVWLPEKLARTVGALEANPAAVLTYSDFVTVENESGKESIHRHGAPPTAAEMLSGRPTLLTSTVVLKKEVFEACGGFPEDLRAFEDHFLFLLVRHRGDSINIGETLVEYHSQPFAARLLKYQGARATFERLMHRTHGRRAIQYIRYIRRADSNALLQEALRRIDARDLGQALRFLGAALRIRPLLFFDYQLNRRLPHRLTRFFYHRARAGSLKPGRSADEPSN